MKRMHSCPPQDDDAVCEARRLFTALLPALAVAPAAAQDAAKVQPAAYRVVLENDKLRVLEFNSRPGMGICGEGLHSHPARLTVALSDKAKAQIRDADGKVRTSERNLGDVWWAEAVTHEVENISGRQVRALIIELKKA